MPQEVKERIVRHLRPELEKVDGLTTEERNAVIGGFTVLENPHRGHIQYRLAGIEPEMDQRSDIEEAISRAVHAAGYYIAGEET